MGGMLSFIDSLIPLHGKSQSSLVTLSPPSESIMAISRPQVSCLSRQQPTGRQKPHMTDGLSYAETRYDGSSGD